MTGITSGRSEITGFRSCLGEDSRRISQEDGVGGIQDPVSHLTSIDKGAQTFQNAHFSNHSESDLCGDRHLAEKTGDLQGAEIRPEQAGILFKPVPGPQAGRYLPANFQYQTAEHLHYLSPFQNGDSNEGASHDSARGPGHNTGSIGCLPARSDKSGLIPVFALCHVPESSVLFPCTSFRSVYSAACFHPHSGSNCGVDQNMGCSHPCLSGRLASTVAESQSTTADRTANSGASKVTRLDSELKEVEVNTVTDFRVSRPVVRYSEGDGKTGGPLGPKSVGEGHASTVVVDDVSSRDSVSVGTVQLHGGLRSSRPPEVEANTALVTQSIFPGLRGSRRPTNNDVRPEGISSPLGRCSLANDRSPPSNPRADCNVIHRRFVTGLGSSARTEGGAGILGPESDHAPHKRARDVGCQTGNQLLSARNHESDLTASVRQCDSSGVSEEGGGHSVSKTVPPRNRHSKNVQRHVHYAGRKAHPFQKKRSGRCFVTHEAINNRVATKQSCVLSDSGAGSKSRAGFIRHKNKYTARPICVSISGSTSSGGRCANNSVARHRSPVCVPPTSVDPTVTRKTTPRASTVVTDSSSMAATTMVSGPAEAVSNQCSTVAPLSGHTRSDWLDTSKARDIQSSCSDVIRGNLNTRGYSDKVSAALAQSVLTSTNSVYDAKWTNYTTWCKQKSCDPLSLDGPQISEYFVHLFEDVGLSYSTLRGYKASLFTVLASVGVLSDEVRLVINSLLLTDVGPSLQRFRPRILVLYL